MGVELVIYCCVAVTVVWLLMKGVSSFPSLTRKPIVAIDTECVGVGFRGRQAMVARVSLVKWDTINKTRIVYDKYVRPLLPVSDYRTFVSGIRPHHLLNGEDFFIVREEVLQLIKGCRLVGHDLKNDLDVLDLWHPPEDIRDTAFCKLLRDAEKFIPKKPSLKCLAKYVLNKNIQIGEHSSLEDAATALDLYLVVETEWEKQLMSKQIYH